MSEPRDASSAGQIHMNMWAEWAAVDLWHQIRATTLAMLMGTLHLQRGEYEDAMQALAPALDGTCADAKGETTRRE
ncbi:MAG: hypothetical protein ACE5LU_01880 [Anaerolineae bacterium]